VGFEFLVQKYRREAFFHAFALLGNQEDALDACQDSFAKAFAAIPRLPELPRFYPWFYCILRHRCLNLLARRQTKDRYRGAQQHDATVAVDAMTPGSLLEQREEQHQVRRALESLKPEHREILVLKYVQEHHYDEIATLLGIPRGTVMSRLYHAGPLCAAILEPWPGHAQPLPEHPRRLRIIQGLLVGLLDGELTPDEARQVNEHLTRCATCRTEYEQLRETTGKLAAISFQEPDDAVLAQVWKSLYSRLARNASLIMIIDGYALLIGYGLFEFLASGREELPAKLGLAAVALGFLILLVQLIRERVKTYKTDPYKEIQR
jgi:RNA polymerase sigma-70 factor (ECF subfamily)